MYNEFTYYYGHKWSEFLAKVYQECFNIIREETNFYFETSAKIVHFPYTTYPLEIVLFEHSNQLGYFRPYSYEIGIHRLFVHTDLETLRNILRHELAHLFDYVLNNGHGHGISYRQMCHRFNWGPEVYLSKSNIDINHYRQLGQQEEKVLRKIKKLLQLAEGESNQHEAELAALKANELMLKNSIGKHQLKEERDFTYQDTILKRIYSARRTSSKVKAIANILSEFYVCPVYNHVEDRFFLEIIGNYNHISIASYVFDFLMVKFDQLWEMDKRLYGLKGLRAKNSYFYGLSHGFITKNRQQKKQIFTSKELIPLEKELTYHKNTVYQKLKTTSSNRQRDYQAEQLGVVQGKNLAIDPALNKSKNSTPKQLDYH